MCIACPTSNSGIKVSYREVSVKALNAVQEAKNYIKSNGEKVKSVTWWRHSVSKSYIGYIVYEYFDGYQIQEDAVQVVTKYV